MTAEIAIINKHGVVLAADSAVTIGGKKVWKNANKIFSLAPHNDIVIMIYNADSFEGLPWETVIKYFRSKSTTFQTMQDCIDSFLRFLLSETITRYSHKFDSTLLFCYDKVNLLVQILEGENITPHHPEYNTHFTKLALRITNHCKEKETILNDIEFDIFSKSVLDGIKAALLKKIPGKQVNEALIQHVCFMCFELYKRKVESTFKSGVVFAGYGADELLPSLIHYCFDGKYNVTLRAWIEDSHDLNNFESQPQIVPFAQRDMCDLFTRGIATKNLEYLQEVITDAAEVIANGVIDKHITEPEKNKLAKSEQKEATKEISKAFINEFIKYSYYTFGLPIQNVLNHIPKEEMASMAAALIGLTSLQRKMDSNIESVGGPTDVVVISKGDGVIWIQRKNYFDILYNKDYETRKQILNKVIGHE